MGSQEVVGKGYVFTKNSQMAATAVTCISKYQLNPWPNSPASSVAIYSRLAACPVKIEPFKDHPI